MNPEESIPTRDSLLERIKNASDQSGWQEFFETYRLLIYKVAIKSGLTDVEAQEVVQETFISVSKSIEDYQYDSSKYSFKSWLLRMTRWRILNQLKKRRPGLDGRKRSSNEPDRTSTVDRIPDPANIEQVWEEEWARTLYETAAARVKLRVRPEQFQLFELSVRREWPIKKIMSALGVSAAQVYLAKHRVSRMLRKELKKLERGGET